MKSTETNRCQFWFDHKLILKESNQIPGRVIFYPYLSLDLRHQSIKRSCHIQKHEQQQTFHARPRGPTMWLTYRDQWIQAVRYRYETSTRWYGFKMGAPENSEIMRGWSSLLNQDPNNENQACPTQTNLEKYTIALQVVHLFEDKWPRCPSE